MDILSFFLQSESVTLRHYVGLYKEISISEDPSQVRKIFFKRALEKFKNLEQLSSFKIFGDFATEEREQLFINALCLMESRKGLENFLFFSPLTEEEKTSLWDDLVLKEYAYVMLASISDYRMDRRLTSLLGDPVLSKEDIEENLKDDFKKLFP